MGNNPSNFKGTKNPVARVRWNDCKVFISKLNTLTGQNFRLPTEAEWEFAARGGNKSQHYKYSGSNEIDKVAWYDGNSDNKTHPVGSKEANELGLYDMSGNVWDWYGDYSSSPQTNPKGPDMGSNRVYRGGSWNSLARICRVSIRSRLTLDYRGYSLGFRLAL
jgi:formylglycine-generating enzyme required for sulfatase activity